MKIKLLENYCVFLWFSFFPQTKASFTWTEVPELGRNYLDLAYHQLALLFLIRLSSTVAGLALLAWVPMGAGSEKMQNQWHRF